MAAGPTIPRKRPRTQEPQPPDDQRRLIPRSELPRQRTAISTTGPRFIPARTVLTLPDGTELVQNPRFRAPDPSQHHPGPSNSRAGTPGIQNNPSGDTEEHTLENPTDHSTDGGDQVTSASREKREKQADTWTTDILPRLHRPYLKYLRRFGINSEIVDPNPPPCVCRLWQKDLDVDCVYLDRKYLSFRFAAHSSHKS